MQVPVGMGRRASILTLQTRGSGTLRYLRGGTPSSCMSLDYAKGVLALASGKAVKVSEEFLKSQNSCVSVYCPR